MLPDTAASKVTAAHLSRQALLYIRQSVACAEEEGEPVQVGAEGAGVVCGADEGGEAVGEDLLLAAGQPGWPADRGLRPMTRAGSGSSQDPLDSDHLDSDYLASYSRIMTPLPMPPAWAGPLPEAAPPPDMAIYQLPTGTYETRAAFAVRGGSFRDKRHFAATAILVQHPKGDLLIDAGFGAGLAAHLAALPRIQRAPHQAAETVSKQLDASGYDRSRLLGVLVTHSHWDHVSGLDELPVPIWMNSGELQYAAEDPGGKVFRTVSAGHEIHEYEFNGPPYLGFPSSFDVYGDGSVVITPRRRSHDRFRGRLRDRAVRPAVRLHRRPHLAARRHPPTC